MRFIDLFAGLGGFNLALKRLGHTCVFACEIDQDLRELYEKNFHITPAGDIRECKVTDIPSHDILCAGFPCQPFSKAGNQQGFDCPKWGNLFSYVLRIIKYHRPQYIILENVPNIERHNDGQTWHTIETKLKRAGYSVCHNRLSPHNFGIPQIRDRLFIIASRSSLSNFSWPKEISNKPLSIVPALNHNPPDAKKLSIQIIQCLQVWQDFIKRFPKEIEIPSFPIWSMEFGATYPFEETTPFAIGLNNLRLYRGSHGRILKNISSDNIMDALPSYARTAERKFPDWKIRFIKQNRELFQLHKHWIMDWRPAIMEFPSSWQKLEWNCKGAERNLWKSIIQFRASGVRIKKPSTSPSLVAMNTTQVPIIAWEKRYMTPRECARLQSMVKLKYLPKTPAKAYRSLGNAVNTHLVEMIAKTLISSNGHV